LGIIHVGVPFDQFHVPPFVDVRSREEVHPLRTRSGTRSTRPASLEALGPIRGRDAQEVRRSWAPRRGGFDEGPDPRPFAAVGVLDDLVLGFAEEVTPFVVFFFLPQMGRANGDEIDVFVIRSR